MSFSPKRSEGCLFQNSPDRQPVRVEFCPHLPPLTRPRGRGQPGRSTGWRRTGWSRCCNKGKRNRLSSGRESYRRLARSHDMRTRHSVDAKGGGRSSAIISWMSALFLKVRSWRKCPLCEGAKPSSTPPPSSAHRHSATAKQYCPSSSSEPRLAASKTRVWPALVRCQPLSIDL
jgi:hypothetical protein